MKENLCPVVEFEDNMHWICDSVKLTNNNKKTKYYFQITHLPNSKYDLQISPMSGELKKA